MIDRSSRSTPVVPASQIPSNPASSAERSPRRAARPAGPLLDLTGARRILAVRLDNIGDVVMTGPALAAIRTGAPQAAISLLCSPAGREGASLLPWVDNTIVTRAVWQDAGSRLPFDPERELALIDRLRASRFDAAFIFTSFSQTPFPPAYACYLAGIPVRAAQAAEFGGSLLTHQVAPAADGTHQVDRNLHLLAALGLPVSSRSLAISLPPSAIDASRRLLATVGIDAAAPFVAIAPGASAAARRYPAARFAEVARLLDRELDWPIVVVGGPGDREAAAMIAAATPRARTIAGRTSTAEWASVIDAAAVLVSSHSAPIHLADALRTPVVCLFSGTDRESEWAPRDTPAVLLREPTACAPCRLFDCPIGLPCLDIEPRAVMRATLELLDGASGGVRPVVPAAAVVTAASASPVAPRTEDRWARSAF